jgi:hypothetical protein
MIPHFHVVDTAISGLTSGDEPDSLGAVEDGRLFLQFLVKFFHLFDIFLYWGSLKQSVGCQQSTINCQNTDNWGENAYFLFQPPQFL